VRNRGTIGGSCAHADPAADFPVILTALDASFVAVSPSGKRTISADDFFVDFYTTALTPNEMLIEIRVPLPPADAGTAYHKLANPASGYVVVSAGALIRRDASGKCLEARIALGGLGGKPFRPTSTENALRGKALSHESIADAALKAAEGSDPDGEVYASAEYKRHIATVLARRAVAEAARRDDLQLRPRGLGRPPRQDGERGAHLPPRAEDHQRSGDGAHGLHQLRPRPGEEVVEPVLGVDGVGEMRAHGRPRASLAGGWEVKALTAQITDFRRTSGAARSILSASRSSRQVGTEGKRWCSAWRSMPSVARFRRRRRSVRAR